MLVRIFIRGTIPLLNDPILESELLFSLTCSGSLCCRIGDGLCLVGVFIGICRSIGANYSVAVTVQTCCRVHNVKTFGAFNDLSPVCVKIDLADRGGIFRVISVVWAVGGIQFAVLADNGVVQFKRIKVPDLGKFLVCEPADQVIEIACTANVTNIIAIIFPEVIFITCIMPCRLIVDITEAGVASVIGMKCNLVFLQHPLGVYGYTAFRHGRKCVFISAALIVKVPAKEHILWSVCNQACRVIVVEAACRASIWYLLSVTIERLQCVSVSAK